MSSQPRSPVCSQPSASIFESVPDVLCRRTWSPRIWISPGSSAPSGVPLVVDDADLDARERLADRTRAGALEQRLVAVEREAVVVGAEDRDGAAGLGEAVGVHEVESREQVERTLGGSTGASGAAVGEARSEATRRSGRPPWPRRSWRAWWARAWRG